MDMESMNGLLSIRKVWVSHAVISLADSSGLRESATELSEKFFDLFVQSVDKQAPSILDPILIEWAHSLTQTDLEGSKSRLISLVEELSNTTFLTLREQLSESQALELAGTLLPYFNFMFSRAAQLEMEVKVNYLTQQLDQVKQSLEKLDRSKSDFIAVAAHELKTPLTLIDGYATMLRENLELAGLLPYQKVLMEGMQNGTRRLRSIIDDMIDVSLIDNNLLSLNFQPLWINRLLSVLVDEFSVTINERKLNLEIRSFAGINELTFGDPERILQVLRNIISNAIKYTPDGGEIIVDGRKLPGFLEVIVRDTGIGIDVEDVQAIFDKFVRLGNTALHSSGKTKFKGGGPGLGLRIAKGIIESHGGTIWVESPGYNENTCPGSVFHILIPLRSEPPDTQMAKLFAPLVPQSQKEEAKP
jgi:signal transduction histidine kinase